MPIRLNIWSLLVGLLVGMFAGPWIRAKATAVAIKRNPHD